MPKWFCPSVHVYLAQLATNGLWPFLCHIEWVCPVNKCWMGPHYWIVYIICEQCWSSPLNANSNRLRINLPHLMRNIFGENNPLVFTFISMALAWLAPGPSKVHYLKFAMFAHGHSILGMDTFWADQLRCKCHTSH